MVVSLALKSEEVSTAWFSLQPILTQYVLVDVAHVKHKIQSI